MKVTFPVGLAETIVGGGVQFSHWHLARVGRVQRTLPGPSARGSRLCVCRRGGDGGVLFLLAVADWRLLQHLVWDM